jgi:hypothetical protein
MQNKACIMGNQHLLNVLMEATFVMLSSGSNEGFHHCSCCNGVCDLLQQASRCLICAG